MDGFYSARTDIVPALRGLICHRHAHRIETRDITVIHNIDWLQKSHQWPGLNSVARVQSTRDLGARIERETASTLPLWIGIASLIGPLIRDHWAVENSLHWVLDMVFRDDECRLRTDSAPANFTTIKHIALNLLRRATRQGFVTPQTKGRCMGR